MPSRWEQVVVDCARTRPGWPAGGPRRSATRSCDEGDDRTRTLEIRRGPDELPGLLFTPVPDAKTVKNRLHLDLRPDDQEAEVERLVGHGRPAGRHRPARRAAGWCWPTRRATSSACCSRAADGARSVTELADQAPGSRRPRALTSSAECRVVFAPVRGDRARRGDVRDRPADLGRPPRTPSPTLRAISSVVADCSSTAAAMVRCPSSIRVITAGIAVDRRGRAGGHLLDRQ